MKMFKSCCCVSNKKAIKKQNENKENGAKKVEENIAIIETVDGQQTKLTNNCETNDKENCDNNRKITSVKNQNGPDSLTSGSTTESNEKTNNSDDDNNKNGLISEGLVEEINCQFTHQLDRLKSTDTTESTVTVIETVDTVANGIKKSPMTMEDEVEDVPVVTKEIPAAESRREKNLCAKLRKQNAKDVDEEEEEMEKVLINQVERRKFIKRESVKSLMGESKPLTSCLLRRGSSKSSFKKRVMYSESTEVIPEPDYFINEDELFAEENGEEDEDEVFSDKVPAKLPRGDMCAPYVARTGSLPMYPLPEWFQSDREKGGVLEPPTTPIGRDELALKRHRFFSDLLEAAQAAIESRVRFDPLGPIFQEVTPEEDEEDAALPTVVPEKIHPCEKHNCDPTYKPSTSTELEGLIVRLERIVERLERSISQRDLDTSQKLLNTALTTASTSVETVRELRGITDYSEEDNLPTVLPNFEKQINGIEQNLNQTQKSEDTSSLEENIPTVIHQLEIKDPPKQEKNFVNNMSVNAYEDIMLGALATYLEKSAKIGDDVATQADSVKKAFDAQFAYIKIASESAAPDQSVLQSLLKPTSEQIMAIQTFREKHRTSRFFNHLSAISESIPALGWVCVSPTPGPHVKEMNDAGQFYTNRVLKEWREKDATHVDWCRSWIQTLTELQQYIKQYHTTGLVWAGKAKATASALNGTSSAGAPPPPPPGGMPPPPPMIPVDFSAAPSGGDERSALFAQINQGADITKNLKKVTADMQTHKNPNLRSGPAPYKAPAPLKSGVVEKPAPVAKPPTFYQEGKKWIIEHQKNNPNLLIEDAEMNNVVYMFKSENSTLNVKGKINSIQVDSCKKCNIVFESLVSSVEFVNCEKIQMQVLGKVPTISIDKSDGIQMYLSKDSLNVEIVSSKSSEMNVMLPTPDGQDYTELAIPEQYKTTISGNSLQTVCNESLG